jgi:hypothetical protein
VTRFILKGAIAAKVLLSSEMPSDSKQKQKQKRRQQQSHGNEHTHKFSGGGKVKSMTAWHESIAHMAVKNATTSANGVGGGGYLINVLPV